MATGFILHSLDRNILIKYRHYERSLIAFNRMKLRLIFLYSCFSEQVVPRSVDITLKCDTEPFPMIKKLILKNSIECCKRDIETLHLRVRHTFAILKNNIPFFVVDDLINIAHNTSRYMCSRTSENLKNKLDLLCSRSLWEKFSSVNSVVNISRHPLSTHQQTLLGLGLSFALPPPAGATIDIASALDNFLYRYRTSVNNPDLLRGALIPVSSSLKNRKHFLPKRLVTALNELKAVRDTVVLPADKGGKVVVMDITEYIAKSNSLLSDDSTYSKLTKNPTQSVNTNFSSSLKQLAKKCPEPKIFDKFIRCNASLPYFYGIPKLHKPNRPLRPIISTVGSASHALAGWLASIMTPYLGVFSQAHLKNSQDFTDKLRAFSAHTDLTNTKMLSLDVSALFTSVPLDCVLNFIKSKYNQNVIELPIPIDVFLDLIRLCVNNNYFTFNNEYYLQTFGVAMGSPLSPVLANIFMEYLESEYLPNLTPRPLLWLRYVDDIFVIWPNNQTFEPFFEQVNGLFPSIKFTTEWESQGTIPFLDCLVHRSETGFKFRIYRKPTQSGMYLHYFSWHPTHIKRGVLISMFLRALRLCDPEFINEELNYISTSFGKLAYPDHFISTALSQARRKFYSDQVTQPNNDNSFKTLSIPHTDQTKTIVPVFAAHNIKIVNKCSNSLKHNLVKTRPSSDSNEIPGTYVIPCKDCPQAYVGQTGRPFSVRLQEHQRYVKLAKENSAVFSHSFHFNHAIDWKSAKIVYKSGNLNNRLIVESALIKHIDNFNQTDGVGAVDHATKDIILKTNRQILNNLPPPLARYHTTRRLPY